MAKIPGLFQRGPVWWLRVLIPADLAVAYQGRSQVVRSLKTSDWREARTLAVKRRDEWGDEFKGKRRELNPEPVARITSELGPTLAHGIRARLLRWDEDLRGSPATAETWLRFAQAFSAGNLSQLRMGPAEPSPLPSPAELEALALRSPLDGLTPLQLRKLAEVNLSADEAAGRVLAGRKLSHVVPLADTEARRLGMLVDWKAPEARPVLLECLRAYRGALGDIVRRDDGTDIETPAAPVKAALGPPLKLRDVFDKWKGAKRRGDDSLKACERSLVAFEAQSGNPALLKITRAHGSDFRAWLLQQDLSSKTAHDRMTWVKSLLRFACRDLEWIPRHPWEGLDIAHHTETPRREWQAEQLQAFFGLPLFKAYALPSGVDAAGAAAYWIPLLGLYTGARIGELCQLRVEDVADDGAGPVLRITKEADGATLKTSASRRDVPLHSELVRLGFLDYVAALRKTRTVSLWPQMKLRKGKPGANFSDWFSAARKLTPEGVPDYHSLRHTVRTALVEAGAEKSIRDRIAGHKVTGGTGTQVYEHPKAEIRRAVEAIKYPGLRLARVYTAKP